MPLRDDIAVFSFFLRVIIPHCAIVPACVGVVASFSGASSAPLVPRGWCCFECAVGGTVSLFGDVFLTRWVLVISFRILFPLSLSRRPILISNDVLWLFLLLEVCKPPLLLLGWEYRLVVNGCEGGSRSASLRCNVHPRYPIQETLHDFQSFWLCIDDLTKVFDFDLNRPLLDHASRQAIAVIPLRCRGVDPFVCDGGGPPKTSSHIKPRTLPGAAYVLENVDGW